MLGEEELLANPRLLATVLEQCLVVQFSAGHVSASLRPLTDVKHNHREDGGVAPCKPTPKKMTEVVVGTEVSMGETVTPSSSVSVPLVDSALDREGDGSEGQCEVKSPDCANPEMRKAAAVVAETVDKPVRWVLLDHPWRCAGCSFLNEVSPRVCVLCDEPRLAT